MARHTPTTPRHRADAIDAIDAVVRDTVAWLERTGTARNRDGMGRFGIVARKAYGVSMPDLRRRAKQLGRSQLLAEALWKTGSHEARQLAAFVGDPAAVTVAAMDRWLRDFENWADCDTVCFHLFDRTPHAFGRVDAWATRKAEVERRAAFALLAGLALHDRSAADGQFLARLPLIESAATDGRNLVKKSVSWALRAIGQRTRPLHAAAVELAERLKQRDDPSSRFIGHDAHRDLTRPLIAARLERRAIRAAGRR